MTKSSEPRKARRAARRHDTKNAPSGLKPQHPPADADITIIRADDGQVVHMDIAGPRIGRAFSRWYNRLREAHYCRSSVVGSAPARERLRRKIVIMAAAELAEDLKVDAPLIEPYWDELIDLTDVDDNILPEAFTPPGNSNAEPSSRATARAFIAATAATRYAIMRSEGGTKNQKRASQDAVDDVNEWLGAVASRVGADPAAFDLDILLPGRAEREVILTLDEPRMHRATVTTGDIRSSGELVKRDLRDIGAGRYSLWAGTDTKLSTLRKIIIATGARVGNRHALGDLAELEFSGNERQKLPPVERVYNWYMGFERDAAALIKPAEGRRGPSKDDDWPLYFYMRSVSGIDLLARMNQTDQLRLHYRALVDRAAGRLLQLADLRRTQDQAAAPVERGEDRETSVH